MRMICASCPSRPRSPLFSAAKSKRLLLVWVVGCVWAATSGFPAAADEAQSPASTYEAKNKRDPFVALVRDGRIVQASADGSSVKNFGEPVLLGILWDPGGRSLALINDTEVKAGDVVGPYHVAEIRADAVVLMSDDDPDPLVLRITFEDSESKKKSPESKGGERP